MIKLTDAQYDLLFTLNRVGSFGTTNKLDKRTHKALLDKQLVTETPVTSFSTRTVITKAGRIALIDNDDMRRTDIGPIINMLCQAAKRIDLAFPKCNSLFYSIDGTDLPKTYGALLEAGRYQDESPAFAYPPERKRMIRQLAQALQEALYYGNILAVQCNFERVAKPAEPETAKAAGNRF